MSLDIDSEREIETSRETYEFVDEELYKLKAYYEVMEQELKE